MPIIESIHPGFFIKKAAQVLQKFECRSANMQYAVYVEYANYVQYVDYAKYVFNVNYVFHANYANYVLYSNYVKYALHAYIYCDLHIHHCHGSR